MEGGKVDVLVPCLIPFPGLKEAGFCFSVFTLVADTSTEAAFSFFPYP